VLERMREIALFKTEEGNKKKINERGKKLKDKRKTNVQNM
jgi:hypothetical protein